MNQLDQSLSPLEQMIRDQVIDRGIRDPRLLDALRTTPREKFFAAEHRGEAFADRAAPIGHGQTISQPFIVALMTDRLKLAPEHRVLEIGTGSGYQTAILAKLAGQVYSIERVKPLLDEAFERLMELNLRNVHLHFGDGTLGWPDGEREPFDRILIAAGAPALPKDLLKAQLKDGGIAVLPIGEDNDQMLTLVTRSGDQFIEDQICPVRFVKLIGVEGWSASGDSDN